MDDRPDERDLATIRRLMEESQQGAPEAGKHFIMWGIVIALALVLTYAALQGAPLSVGWVWALTLGAGWGLSLWTGWRRDARAPVQSIVGRVVAGIWIGCGVSATLVTALGYYGEALPPSALPGTVSLVIAVGYFASSFAYRSPWMRVLAVGWWLGAAGMLLRPGPRSLLAMAGLLVALQIIPGLVFYRRARLEQATPEA